MDFISNIINTPLGYVMRFLADILGGNFAASVFAFTLLINLIFLQGWYQMEKYSPSALANLIEKKLSHNFGVMPNEASDDLFYKATVLVLLDIMRQRRTAFKKETAEKGAKTVYYLSMEFLMGRSLKNNLYNLELTDKMAKALKKYISEMK